MTRTGVQPQKRLSEPDFERLCGTEDQCRAAIVASRWPDGFVCPVCGGTRHSVVKTRRLYQCSACQVQTAPIAGTIFAATSLKLRVWFRALYRLTQTGPGISSIGPGRPLGVTQTTALKIKRTRGQVMPERDGAKQLHGRIGIDDACIGGERHGWPGAGAAPPAGRRSLRSSRPRRKASPSA